MRIIRQPSTGLVPPDRAGPGEGLGTAVPRDGERSRPSVVGHGAVKICGMRRPEDAAHAVRAGADLIGLIFAPGRRRVTAEEGRRVADAARSARPDSPPLIVGVFVDGSAGEVNEVAAAVGLDLVQLNGDEPPETVAAVTVPVIKALRPPPGTTVEAVLKTVAPYAALQRPPVAYLIDGYDPVAHGGTGHRADWDLAASLAARIPLVLAGGLTPENVSGAITRVHPLAVDVSSGTEIDGARDPTKDPAKVTAFIGAAWTAFVSVAPAPARPGGDA